ncbi:DNA-binding FadR family transcriptional regulator [Alteromonadaceae bacterium 2753L.S.0a.02]|nr:DNA-binding FadR family transcriptional regulator [Alteromonadaceae bacterium 2753L.S.0a.02]
MLTPIKSLTLVDQANQQLLAYIDECALQAGDSLPSIAQLVDLLGASRAVVRESLRSLEARGIIEVANGRRARVKPVTCEPLFGFFQRFSQVEDRAVWEFAEIRVALELQCVRLAAERGTDDQFQGLCETVKLMRRNINRPDKFAELDMQFHLQIAHATQNTMMVHLLESLRDAIRDCIRSGLHKKPSKNQMNTVQTAHERLVDRLVARDVAGAEQALHAHFNESVMLLD